MLAAWTALEVLSPQSFRRETDLTGGDRKNYKLYHQVVLGTVKLDAAVARNKKRLLW